jgi:hypothetical protein
MLPMLLPVLPMLPELTVLPVLMVSRIASSTLQHMPCTLFAERFVQRGGGHLKTRALWSLPMVQEPRQSNRCYTLHRRIAGNGAAV